MDDLKELFRMASKHFGDGDDLVGATCNDLVKLFDVSHGSRGNFIDQLQEAAKYSGWQYKLKKGS